MNERLLALAQRIRDELIELERLIHRAREGWRRTKQSADDFYLDSVALNLHGFYVGLEPVFTLVAGLIDGTEPQGANWHQAVLDQMGYDGGHLHYFTFRDLEALGEAVGLEVIHRPGIINAPRYGRKNRLLQALLGERFVREFRTFGILLHFADRSLQEAAPDAPD